MFTAILKQEKMIRADAVKRKMIKSLPPSVEYNLMEKGKAVAELLGKLDDILSR